MTAPNKSDTATAARRAGLALQRDCFEPVQTTYVCLILSYMTDELSVTAKQTKDVMKYNHTIQKILTQHHADKFKNKVSKEEHFKNYAKETDKNKKIEMLRQAAQEGWI